jgi:hypothetical protein
MATNYNPRTVTDGLVFALDAANIKGYDRYENLRTNSNSGGFFPVVGSYTSTGTSTDILAPDGSNTTYKVVASGTQQSTIDIAYQQITLTAGVTYTVSLYYYATGSTTSSRNIGIQFFGNGAADTTFTLPQNTWVRQSLTFTANSTNNFGQIRVISNDYGTFNSQSGATVYLWGAQLERGSTANDYYPTTTTAKTRGTTLTDLSLTKNTATLLNTPTFSNTNGGYLSFASASSQYATAPNLGSLTNWTLETFVRFTSSYNGKVAMVVGGQYDLLSNLNFTIGTNNAPINYNIAVGFFNGAWRSTTGVNYALNTWFHIVGTYDGTTIRQYTNGTQVDSLNYTGTPSSGGEVRINRRWDDVVSSGNLFDSNIATVRIYNRALTASEIQQNYNATKSRFGL